MTRGTHYDGQASMVKTHFKRFFNSHVIFALFLYMFLPVSHSHVHDSLWIERRTPEVLNSHLSISFMQRSRYRLSAGYSCWRLQILTFEVVLTRSWAHGIRRLNSNKTPTLLL